MRNAIQRLARKVILKVSPRTSQCKVSSICILPHPQREEIWHVLLPLPTCNRDYSSRHVDARIISLKILAFLKITDEYKCDLKERITLHHMVKEYTKWKVMGRLQYLLPNVSSPSSREDWPTMTWWHLVYGFSITALRRFRKLVVSFIYKTNLTFWRRNYFLNFSTLCI